MPRFDGTGPRGLGPGTGWGLGPCGDGFGRRRGFGRGFGRRYFGYAPFYQKELTKEDEIAILEEEAEALKKELKAVEKEISELKASK